MPQKSIAKWLKLALPAAALAATALFSAILSGGRRWALLCMLAALLACLPPLLIFERKSHNEHTLVLVAVMAVLTAISRTIFEPLPGIKPVTALVIVTALHFGAHAGFATGALAALLSGLTMGLGPWTPFQMFSWGFIGLLAGLLSNPLRRSRLLLCLFAALSGILYSLIMDVFTVLWISDGNYIVIILAAVKFTLRYAISNVVFMLMFGIPLGKIFTRIKRKYAR